MDINGEIKALLPEIESIRADIHNHPELSFEEHRTTQIIRDFLESNSLQIIETGMKTGVVAYLKGRKSGCVTALRADIDAIETDNGPAHLCGHDYHTAALLCCAKYASLHRDILQNDAVFIFQPAEEVTEGAKALIDSGLFEKLPVKPDMIFGIHNRPEMPDGTIRIQSGPLMARKSDFTITVTGKTGHSGSPHQCVDPITAAAGIIQAVQTIVSRNVNPFAPCVCAICSVHGGTAANFAPESVVMTGSVRALDDLTHDLCINRIREIVNDICSAYKCKADFDVAQRVPVLYNSPEMTEKARIAAKLTVGEENIVSVPPCLGSEDFAVYGKYLPSYFFWVGSGNPDAYNAPWHSNNFTVGKRFLYTASSLFTNLLFLS